MEHIPSTPFDQIPGALPSCKVPADADLNAVKGLLLSKLLDPRPDDFADEALWRDIVALTGSSRTIYSGQLIHKTLQASSLDNNCSEWRLTDRPPQPVPFGWIDVEFTFQTQRNGVKGQCAGVASVGLFPEGQWRIWLLRTWLEQFIGHNNPDTLQPGLQVDESIGREDEDSEIYDAIVIGGGQGGLSNAGRLHALGLKYVLLEQYQNVGDVWRKRYSSLRWHTIKEYGNLPFGRTYSTIDEEMIPTEKIGEAQEAWATQHGINIRNGVTVTSAEYEAATQIWTVKAETTNGSTLCKQAKNLILAIGPGSSYPSLPVWATPERIAASGYKGIIMHSAEYVSCDDWKGSDKLAVVIGTANTAHDVAEDMANAGLHTTMVQRGKTFILPAEWLGHSMQRDYNTEKTTEQADRDTYTYPIKVIRELANMMIHSQIRGAPERFDRLEAAGFRVDRYGDIFNHLCVRFGGHYVDTGNGRRIADGEIKVVGKPIRCLVREGIQFEDDTVLAADIIVLATGYEHDFRRHAARIIGTEAASQMEEYWGLDAEGELRGQGKIAGYPHLLCQGGDTRHARWTSRFIALQIQADKLGQRAAVC